MAAAFHPSGRTALWGSLLSTGGRTPGTPGPVPGKGRETQGFRDIILEPVCPHGLVNSGSAVEYSRITCLPAWREAKNNMIAIIDCVSGLHGAHGYAFPHV
jgi:hypothetical protein